MAKITSVTPDEARKGIYIDFEGTMTEPPSMLGILYATDDDQLVFDQPVFERELWPATSYTPTKSGGYEPRAARLDETIRQLQTQATRERRKLFAFTSHELEEITKDLDATTTEWWNANLVNVLPHAKKWAKTHHPDYVFQKKNYKFGKHSLDQFFGLIGYSVSDIHGPGKSAKRIRVVRNALVNKAGDMSKLTPRQRGHWTKAMRHNWHDCEGTRKLMIEAATSNTQSG